MRLLAVIAALAALVAGCGGGGDGKALTFPQFQRAANRVCARYAKAVNALPRAKTMSGIARTARKTYALGRKERAALRQLDEPKAAHDDFARLLDRMGRADELLPDVWQAASQGDQVQVRKLVAQAKPLVAQGNRSAFALGLDDCRRR